MNRLFILLVPCLLAACEQLPELRYETEHLRVGTLSKGPLCQGNLDRMELMVTTAEAALGVDLKRKVEVYLWDEENPGWCDETAVGCYDGTNVYGSELSIPHELVHVIVELLGDPVPFWDEGAAEAINLRRTRRGVVAPSTQLDGESGELSYNTVGHFSRWLIEREGIERFAEMLAVHADARTAFEAVYDMSFDEAEALYLAEAPDSYAAYVPCPYPELDELSPTQWSESLTLDCSDPDTYGSFLGVSTGRRFTVTQRGYYTILIDGDDGSLARCHNEDVEVTPSLDDTAMYGDFPPYTETWIKGYARGFDGGETVTFELTPGEYVVGAGFSSERVGQIQVDITLTEPIPAP